MLGENELGNIPFNNKNNVNFTDFVATSYHMWRRYVTVSQSCNIAKFRFIIPALHESKLWSRSWLVEQS